MEYTIYDQELKSARSALQKLDDERAEASAAVKKYAAMVESAEASGRMAAEKEAGASAERFKAQFVELCGGGALPRDIY